MAGPIPILIMGSALLFLGDKKKKKTKKSMVGEPCDTNSPSPDDMVCKGGILYPLIIDESMLEEDENSGEFETKEEDLSEGDDEETESEFVDQNSEDEGSEDSSLRCEEFLHAIHVKVTEEGEIPIHKVAVEQTVIPTMEAVLEGNLSEDADVIGPAMVAASLKELVPVCDWKYDEDLFEFTFDGKRVTSESGRDVIYGLLQLSDRLIEDSNQGAQD